MNWSKEMYIGFKYEAVKTFFHTFEAEDKGKNTLYGLSFSSTRDADIFHQEVQACASESTLVTLESLGSRSFGIIASNFV